MALLAALAAAPARALPPPTGTIEFSSASYSVGEGDGFAEITLIRTGGTATAIQAVVRTTAGTAAGGVDFTAVEQTVTFAHLDTTPQVLQIPILEDALPEGEESVVIEIRAAENSPPRSSALLTIADNDLSAIPSLSRWGVLLLAGCLAAAGCLGLRGRRPPGGLVG